MHKARGLIRGNDKYTNGQGSRIKTFLVDTIATIVFFTIIAGATELFIARIEPQIVLITRLLTIPMMVLTARPYTMWRDFVFARLLPRGKMSGVGTDILAFLTFQVPVYVTTLFVAGASWTEIQIAVSTSVIFMVILSRPFGLFLETVRRWTGTATR